LTRGRIMARKSYLLRIDQSMYDQLEAWAAEEMRSVNGQIEYLLRQALAKRGVKLPPEEKGEGGSAEE
jgi:hypothetical protein